MMTATRVLTGDQLRLGLPKNLAPALRAAAASMGPSGRAVLYEQGASVRRATAGIDIIRHFTGDSVEETLLRETFVAAQQDLNDGISRLAAMFEGALHSARRAVAAGVHPTALSRSVTALLPEVDEHFATLTRHTTDPEPVLRGFDLPDLALPPIRDALAKAGDDGHIEVSARRERGIDHIAFRGFLATMEPLLDGTLDQMDRVHVLVVNDILNDLTPLVPVIEGFAKSDKSLVIAARGLEGTAKQLLEQNRVAGVLRVMAFAPARKGDRAVDILTDLAVATGATLIAEETGQSLARLTPDMLGTATSLRRQGTRLIFSEPQGDTEEIAARLKTIEAVIQKNRYLALDREFAQRRYTRLAGRWVELAVGDSPTCPDLRERIERAMSAVRGVRTHGGIEGAGKGLSAVAALLEARPPGSEDARAARSMLACALRGPERALRVNDGRDDGYSEWSKNLPELTDPADLSRNLLEIAVSLALQMMTLEAAVLRH